MRSRRRNRLNLFATIPAIVIMLPVFLFTASTHAQDPSGPQSQPKEKAKLKDFGSSLGRLKWDSKKGNAVEIVSKKDSSQTNDDAEVVRVETDLVVCDVQVRDPKGNLVKGLTKNDFVVIEENMLQQIEHFSLGTDLTVPRTIVLLIDYSGSQSPYIKNSVEAAKILVDSLGPEDWMAIVTDDVELLVQFTQDRTKLKKALNRIRNKADVGDYGKSKQFTALMATVREMFSAEDMRPIVVFQTDGDEVLSLRPSVPSLYSIPSIPDKGEFRQYHFSLRDIYHAIEKSNASVYTVIPGYRSIPLTSAEIGKPASGDNPRRYSGKDMISWGQMAAAGAAIGGWTAFLNTPEQAPRIYKEILEDIGNRYVIGYYPINRARDGKRRRVRVEVRDHPDYQITGRKSYFAPGPSE